MIFTNIILLLAVPILLVSFTNVYAGGPRLDIPGATDCWVDAVVAMTTAATVQAGGPVGRPHPGQCTCNAASGVMTGNAMPPPYNKWNNGCIEDA